MLLIPIAFGCGSNSSDNTQNDTEDEGFHLQISNVGDINGDGIQDSVVLEMMAFTNTDSIGCLDLILWRGRWRTPMVVDSSTASVQICKANCLM